MTIPNMFSDDRYRYYLLFRRNSHFKMTWFFNVRFCRWLFKITNRTLHTLKKLRHFKTANVLEQKFLPIVPDIELQKTDL